MEPKEEEKIFSRRDWGLLAIFALPAPCVVAAGFTIDAWGIKDYRTWGILVGLTWICIICLAIGSSEAADEEKRNRANR